MTISKNKSFARGTTPRKLDFCDRRLIHCSGSIVIGIEGTPYLRHNL